MVDFRDQRSFVEYHHIIPYSSDPHSCPEDMMVLCSTRHYVCTTDALTEREQREAKSRPKNIVNNELRGLLYVNATELRVNIAGGFAVDTPAFDVAPSRNRLAGWTAARQRTFIDILSLTGSVGEASAAAGVSSRSAYRLRNRAGADGFARAWDIAQQMSATRLTALAFDRAINGRVERFYKDGELVMERRLPSDRLLTWLLAHLDPVRFGGAARQAMLGTSDPRTIAAAALPALTARLADVDPGDCECEPPAFVDDRSGEMGSTGSVDREGG